VVPISLRIPQVETSDETVWQKLVIVHLGLADWLRLTPGCLDLVGPTAQRVLRRHGLLWPSNTYVHEPVLPRPAAGRC
jgi:asparagine synthase (glutamine-hydrolysing)